MTTESKVLELLGAPGSPYTHKILAVLRFRNIPYRLEIQADIPGSVLDRHRRKRPHAAAAFTSERLRENGEKYVFSIPDIIIEGRAASWPGYTVERVIEEMEEQYRKAVLKTKGKGENGKRPTNGGGVAGVVRDLLDNSRNKKAPIDPTINRGG